MNGESYMRRLEHRKTWVPNAACSQMDQELFYPENGLFPKELLDVVKPICDACPVKEDCQEWMIYHEGQGFGGGLTPKQRQQIRARANITLLEPQMNLLNASVKQRKGSIDTIPHGTERGYATERRLGIYPCQPCLTAHSNKSKVRLASGV